MASEASPQTKDQGPGTKDLKPGCGFENLTCSQHVLRFKDSSGDPQDRGDAFPRGMRAGAPPPGKGRCARGFSLVEVMIAASLTGFVLWGVLTTNLQLLRSGVRITQYAEMEAQVRRGLEQLGHDLKIAIGLRWNGASDITLTVPSSGGTTSQVTYAWTATAGVFFLVPGADSTATAGRVNLIAGIPPLANGNPGLAFARFDRDGNAATTDLATKRVQVTLTATRKAPTAAASSQNLVSATFTMRNKAVN